MQMKSMILFVHTVKKTTEKEANVTKHVKTRQVRKIDFDLIICWVVEEKYANTVISEGSKE